MTTPYKVQVKLGGCEFQAEGPQDVVKEDFLLFLDAVKMQSTSRGPAATPVSSPINESPQNGLPGGRTLSDEALSRVFMVDADGQVSLRILPRTQQREADSLLVLLYGFRFLVNQMDVLVGRLRRAAETSGLTLDRVDRALIPHVELLTKGGQRVGSRWGLNNRGIVRAEEIISGMLE